MSKPQPCLPRVKTPPTSYISILCMRGRSGAGGKGRRRKEVSGTFIHYVFWLSETCGVPVLQRLKTIFGKPYYFEGQSATVSVRAINSWLAKKKINVWNIEVTLSIYSANLTDTRQYQMYRIQRGLGGFCKIQPQNLTMPFGWSPQFFSISINETQTISSRSLCKGCNFTKFRSLPNGIRRKQDGCAVCPRCFQVCCV